MVTPADGGYARSFPIDGIRRRLRSIGIWALVGLAIGAVAIFALPRSYASTVTVVIDPSLGNPFSPTDSGQSLDNVTTEVAVANSTPVAEAVRKTVAPQSSAKDLRDACTPDRLPNSQIITITCADPSRTRARTIAGAFADAFLDYRKGVSKSATESVLSNLQKGITTARDQIDENVRKLAAAVPNSNAYLLAQSRIRSASSTLSDLETQADQVQFSQSEAGRVLSPATLPPAGLGKVRLVFPILGLILLGGLGLLLAARNALRDDRIYNARDLDTIGPPVLAVPESLRGASSALEADVSATVSAAFRGRLGPDRRAVVLTAIGPGVTTHRAALRIVESLRSQASLDVALVELAAAGARGRDHELVAVGGGRDVAAPGPVHLDGDGVGPAYDTDAPVYRILGERLERQQFRELVERLGARHELVVVAGALLAEPATLDAVEAIGDTMLVVPMGRYSDQEVRSAVDQVRLFHGRVVALVTG